MLYKDVVGVAVAAIEYVALVNFVVDAVDSPA